MKNKMIVAVRPARPTAGVPGVCLLVLFGDEEPDKVGVTQPPLLVHPPVTDGINRETLEVYFLKRNP